MKIKKITSEHRSDFTAVMECEHCGAESVNRYGYHDGHYHNHVIPAMTCAECGKNRAGESPVVRNDQGIVHVPAGS